MYTIGVANAQQSSCVTTTWIAQRLETVPYHRERPLVLVRQSASQWLRTEQSDQLPPPFLGLSGEYPILLPVVLIYPWGSGSRETHNDDRLATCGADMGEATLLAKLSRLGDKDSDTWADTCPACGVEHARGVDLREDSTLDDGEEAMQVVLSFPGLNTATTSA